MAGIPLGDENDPMVAAALSVITGGATKAAAVYDVMPDGVEMLPHFGENPMKGGMVEFIGKNF